MGELNSMGLLGTIYNDYRTSQEIKQKYPQKYTNKNTPTTKKAEQEYNQAVKATGAKTGSFSKPISKYRGSTYNSKAKYQHSLGVVR